jgi:hypothetical protein
MPSITIEVAYKWLNIDTYWNMSSVVDPGDDQQQVTVPERSQWLATQRRLDDDDGYPPPLKRKYPLVDQEDRKIRKTHLHDPKETDRSVATLVEQLVYQLKQEVQKRNWGEARSRVSQIENICASLKNTNHKLLITEARIEFAMAYRAMGENALALQCFEESAKEFKGYGHGEALARWMAGCIQLETPKTHFDKGLVNWQMAWEIFAGLVKDKYTQLDKAEVQWYKCRANLMFKDIQEALGAGGVNFPSAVIGHTAPLTTPLPGSTGPHTGGLTPTPHTAAVEGEWFWWHSINEAILIAQAGPGTAGYWVSRLNEQEFPADGELPVRQRHHFGHAEFHDLLTRQELIWLPKQGAVAVGLPTPVIAEAERFWWHSLGQAVRVTALTGGVYGAGVTLERLDGGEFPAQGDTPASRRCHVPLAEFNTLLETHDLVWLAAPQAAEAAAEPPPMEAAPTPASPGPSLAEIWLRIGTLQEFESIRAHPAGSGRVEANPDGFAEINRVYLNSLPHRLFGLTGSNVIALNLKEQYDFIRVEGDSMNAAKPAPINDGDYVLVRHADQVENGAIVAANIIDPATGDRTAALKRRRKDGLYSESTEEYPVVPLTLVERLWGEVIAVAKRDREGEAAGAPA